MLYINALVAILRLLVDSMVSEVAAKTLETEVAAIIKQVEHDKLPCKFLPDDAAVVKLRKIWGAMLQSILKFPDKAFLKFAKELPIEKAFALFHPQVKDITDGMLAEFNVDADIAECTPKSSALSMLLQKKNTIYKLLEELDEDDPLQMLKVTLLQAFVACQTQYCASLHYDDRSRAAFNRKTTSALTKLQEDVLNEVTSLFEDSKLD